MKIRLKPEEISLLKLLARGMSIERISIQLNDSDPTKTNIRRARLLRRFRVKDESILIQRAIAYGLIPERKEYNSCPDNKLIREVLNMPLYCPELSQTPECRELLINTGYAQFALYLDEFVIEYFLEMYPEYIALWREWKRKSPGEGWFYRIERSNVFVVGSFVEGKPQPMFVYAREAKACAVFIKRELERIRAL